MNRLEHTERVIEDYKKKIRKVFERYSKVL
jgi:hypothetical protein